MFYPAVNIGTSGQEAIKAKSRTKEALMETRGIQDDPNRLGAVVRARRMELGLTLREAAAEAGCATSYLSAIETGHRSGPAEGLLARLESVLRLPAGRLVGLGAWAAAPPSLKREMTQMQGVQRGLEARLRLRDRAAGRLSEIVGSGGFGAGALDEAFRSGELRRLVEQLSPSGPCAADGVPAGEVVRVALPREVPLINRVAAGYPTEFTDLGYPARVADEYVRCPELDDPDAFAARVVGESMLPDYREGDIVVFSPLREVKSGMDCFVRLERGDETTFKRVYFEEGNGREEMIRLQPLNSSFPARVVEREEVAGLYAAVSVTRAV
jgi:repressor LexA